jgi:hypothetical protein
MRLRMPSTVVYATKVAVYATEDAVYRRLRDQGLHYPFNAFYTFYVGGGIYLLCFKT